MKKNPCTMHGSGMLTVNVCAMLDWLKLDMHEDYILIRQYNKIIALDKLSSGVIVEILIPLSCLSETESGRL
jgi:hypothetical protein